MTSEVYGQPSQSSVYCSAGCVSSAAADKEAASKLGFAT